MARSDRGLRGWLLATGAVYALGAADFLARPWSPTRSLNRYGGERIEDEPGGFYNSLAGAYMATIAALALESARGPGRPDPAPAGGEGGLLFGLFVPVRPDPAAWVRRSRGDGRFLVRSDGGSLPGTRMTTL